MKRRNPSAFIYSICKNEILKRFGKLSWVNTCLKYKLLSLLLWLHVLVVNPLFLIKLSPGNLYGIQCCMFFYWVFFGSFKVHNMAQVLFLNLFCNRFKYISKGGLWDSNGKCLNESASCMCNVIYVITVIYYRTIFCFRTLSAPTVFNCSILSNSFNDAQNPSINNFQSLIMTRAAVGMYFETDKQGHFVLVYCGWWPQMSTRKRHLSSVV